MNAKKHKELLDVIISRSSYKGFINYNILVSLLKKYSCYEDFIENVDIERIINRNGFATNSYVLGLAFSWRHSDRGDIFWRTINLIYLSLILINEKQRRQLYFNYKFKKLGEFEYLSLIYYFGVENGVKLFYWLTKSGRCSSEVKYSKNYFNKNIKIINEMTDSNFIKNSELVDFLYDNEIYDD